MQMTTAAVAAPAANDFDFLVGSWNVRNRRLARRWEGCREWDEFPATCECRSVLGGGGNTDEYFAPERGFHGMTVRLFDVERREWSLYWASSRTGRLDPPVVGRFEGGRGEFHGHDTDGGRPVRVRFIWNPSTSPRWEQAFSDDGGLTWETNWIMEFTRAESGAR
jgi:hypothetical protein